MYKNESFSIISNSLWPHGQQPARPLRPWNSQGQNTGVGCLLQGIFLTQGLNLGLPHCREILYHPSYQEAVYVCVCMRIYVCIYFAKLRWVFWLKQRFYPSNLLSLCTWRNLGSKGMSNWIKSTLLKRLHRKDSNPGLPNFQVFTILFPFLQRRRSCSTLQTTEGAKRPDIAAFKTSLILDRWLTFFPEVVRWAEIYKYKDTYLLRYLPWWFECI